MTWEDAVQRIHDYSAGKYGEMPNVLFVGHDEWIMLHSQEPSRGMVDGGVSYSKFHGIPVRLLPRKSYFDFMNPGEIVNEI